MYSRLNTNNIKPQDEDIMRMFSLQITVSLMNESMSLLSDKTYNVQGLTLHQLWFKFSDLTVWMCCLFSIL